MDVTSSLYQLFSPAIFPYSSSSPLPSAALVYEAWLAEAVARGRIKAPGFFGDPAIRKAYADCKWNGPSRTALNPPSCPPGSGGVCPAPLGGGFAILSTSRFRASMYCGYANAAELQKYLEALATIKENIISLYAKKTGHTKEEVTAWMDAEKWWTGPQAIVAADAHTPPMRAVTLAGCCSSRFPISTAANTSPPPLLIRTA